MSMLLLLLGLAGAAAAQSQQAAAAAGWDVPDGGALAPAAGSTPILRRGQLSARVLALSSAEKSSAPAADKHRAPTLATFTSKVAVGKKKYSFTMVGSNPFKANARSVLVPVNVIPVVLHFADGTVLDPTAAGSGCFGDASALNLTLQSPLFVERDYGEGFSRQFLEQVRRLEFWAYTNPGGLNPNYSVRLATRVLPALDLSPDAEIGVTQPGTCGRIGRLWGPRFDTLVRTIVLPQLPRFGVARGEFVLLVFLNTLTEFPDATAAGYHSQLGVGGQTYGVAMYDATGASGGFTPDVAVLSHEIAEWLDNPYGNNPTPPWRQSGQDFCQNQLEVGDPLSRTVWPGFTVNNNFFYHPQETAFFSWFYRQVPSLGAGGVYSSRGTLQTPAGPCR